MKPLTQCLALSLVLLGAGGCSQLDRALLREEITEQMTMTEVISAGVTNVYYSTNYFTNYTAAPMAEFIAETTNVIPVWGGLISTVLSGALGVYASIRNKRKGQAIAEALVLANEAGRQILRKMPDGDRIDSHFKQALVEEQMALGKADEITKVVKRVTRPIRSKTLS